MNEPLTKDAPTPGVPLTLGILNVVFASVMLLCCGGSSLYQALVQPRFDKLIRQAQEKEQVKQADLKKAELAELTKEEEEATDEEQKKAVRTKRAEVEARPTAAMPTMPDVKALGLDKPKIAAYGWADLVTGLVANVAMLFAGIALIKRKEWGRKLGIWVALGKIARLVILYSFLAFAVVPEFSHNLAKFAVNMITQQQKSMGRPAPAGLSPGMLARTYTVMFTLFCVAFIILGAVYPTIAVVMLTRPGVKAACGGAKPPVEPELL